MGQNFELIYKSKSMQEAVRLARQVAPANGTTVIITGLPGTGKEVIADEIQRNSSRALGPYIKVNIGSLTDSIVASELFGHEKGSFTGAERKYDGQIAIAEGGTLFLDEIGDLPPASQIHLLRVIQNKELLPVGSNRPKKINVRIIAATNKDLKKMVSEGKFRQDLYDRINVFPIHIPPLRDRREDILPLVEIFIKQYSAELGYTAPIVGQTASDLLENYEWPSNVRGIQNVVQRTLIKAKNVEILEAEHISLDDDQAFISTSRKEAKTSIAPSDIKEKGFRLIENICATIDKDGDINIAIELENFRLLAMIKLMESSFPDLTQVLPRIGMTKAEFLELLRVRLSPEKGSRVEPNINPATNLKPDEEKDKIVELLLKHKGLQKPAADEMGLSIYQFGNRMVKYGLRKRGVSNRKEYREKWSKKEDQ